MSEEKKEADNKQGIIAACLVVVFLFVYIMMHESDTPQQEQPDYPVAGEMQHGNDGSAGQPNFSGFSVSIPRVDETTQRMAEGRYDWDNDRQFQRHIQRLDQQMENLQRIDGPRKTDL